jgi:hypothetical protein
MRKIISATWAIKKRWAHSFYRQRKEYVGGVELRFLGAFREAINVILAKHAHLIEMFCNERTCLGSDNRMVNAKRNDSEIARTLIRSSAALYLWRYLFAAKKNR